MKYQITRDKFFNGKQQKTIKDYCDAKADYDRTAGRSTWIIRRMLVRIAFFSGLRVQEIANLKIKDLHIDDPDPYIFVRRGKGGKSRDVYLSPDFAKDLKKFIKDKRNFVQGIDPEDPLLTGRGGRHFTATALTLSFREAVIKSGLPHRPGHREKGAELNLSIHSARHTYACNLYSQTKDLRYVKKQLGHSSIVMTDLYTNVLPEENGKLARMLVYD